MKPFLTPEDVPGLPRGKALDDMIPGLHACGAIKLSDLEDGACYQGDHRQAVIARWDAAKSRFEYWRHKFGDVFIDTCNHFEQDDGYSLFVPIKKVTLKEFEETSHATGNQWPRVHRAANPEALQGICKATATGDE